MVRRTVMNITLYELLELTEDTFDTYDTVYDAIVTIDWIDTEKYYYDKFCMGIVKLVNVCRRLRRGEVSANWTEMIIRGDNLDVFKEFAEKNWKNKYEDDVDEFVCQWIKEIHYWMAGYTSEDVYKDFVENYLPRLV